MYFKMPVKFLHSVISISTFSRSYTVPLNIVFFWIFYKLCILPHPTKKNLQGVAYTAIWLFLSFCLWQTVPSASTDFCDQNPMQFFC